MALPGGGGDFEIIGKIVIDDQGTATITGLKSGLSGLQGSADATAGSFSSFGTVVDFALGTLAAHAIESLIGWIGQMSTAWLDSAAAEEKTLASLNQTLISTGDASGLTAQKAEELAMQFRDLAGGSDVAVLSAEKILARFTNISGATFPTAIKATLDLAAAMGTDASSAAQLLGRMLEEPGLGAQRLSQTLGFQLLPAQAAAIRKMTEMGDVAQAQDILLQLLAEHTGGQAAAAADTLSGKWSILTGHAHDFGDELGTHLLPLLEHLLDVVTPMLDQFYSAFENTFVPLIDEAAAWGEGIVNALAQGMQSAFGLVEQVIGALGSLIGDLMAPGSPPKFLPLLDVWGREAVDVYLKGWTTFDKSVFDEIGKAIKAGLPAAEISQYATTMHALADANAAVTAAQNNLNSVTSQYDAILNPLNEKLMGEQNAEQKIKDATDIAALQNVIGSSFYSAAQKKEAALEIEQIKTKEQIAAVTLEKDTAVGAAKAKLDAAKEHQSVIAVQAASMKNAIDIQAEETQGIKEMTGAVGALHTAMAKLGSLGSLAGLGTAHKPAIPEDKAQKDDNTQVTNQAIAAEGAQRRIDAFMNHLQTLGRQAATYFAPITTALQGMKQAFDTQLPTLQADWQGFLGFLKSQSNIMSPQIKADFAAIVAGIGQMVTGVTPLMGGLGFVADRLKANLQSLLTFVDVLITGVTGGFAVMFTLVGTIFQTGGLLIEGKWQAAHDTLIAGLQKAWTTIQNTAYTNMELLAGMFGTTWEAIQASIQTAWGKIQTAWDTFWTGFQSSWSGDWAMAQTILGTAWTGIQTTIQTTWTTITTWFAGLGPQLQGIGQAVIQGLIDGAKSMVQSLIDAVTGAVTSALDAAKNLLGIHSPSTVFAGLGDNMMQGMALGMQRSSGLLNVALAGALSSVTNSVSNVSSVNNNNNQRTSMVQNFYTANQPNGLGSNYSLLRARVGI